MERVGTMPGRVRVGTCSWTDPGLVRQTAWYPRRTMTSSQRLAFYASRFSVVEVDSTYYFPPTPDLARRWDAATPEGFVFDVKAYSLLTGHPTLPQSLWPDLAEAVAPRHRGKRRLYASHLDPTAVDVIWGRFVEALLPLADAGKLGLVLVQYPRWFGPSDTHRRELASLVERLRPLRGCVELRHQGWMAGELCETTLSLLEDLGLTHVCTDEPRDPGSSVPPVVATTTDTAVVRFHGRQAPTWERAGAGATRRLRYRYRRHELEEWLEPISTLASATSEVHVLMNNCWRDDAVTNAAQLARLLAGEEPEPDDAGPPPPRAAQLRLPL